MTLVVFAVTQEYILHAADCRFVRGRYARQFRDEEVKAVVFCNSAIFGFTGRAYIDDPQTERTDHWLCDALAGSPHLEEQLLVLKGRADDAFGSRGEHQAFAAAAWGEKDGVPSPFLALVSNYHDAKTGQALSEASPKFSVLLRELRGPERTLLHSVGAALHDDEDDELEGVISGLSQQRLDFEQALWQFAQVIRRVADRDDSVGRGVLLTAISREARQGRALGYSAYMPADASRPIGKAPHVVCGGSQMREIQYHAVTSDGRG